MWEMYVVDIVACGRHAVANCWACVASSFCNMLLCGGGYVWGTVWGMGEQEEGEEGEEEKRALLWPSVRAVSVQ